MLDLTSRKALLARRTSWSGRGAGRPGLMHILGIRHAMSSGVPHNGSTAQKLLTRAARRRRHGALDWSPHDANDDEGMRSCCLDRDGVWRSCVPLIDLVKLVGAELGLREATRRPISSRLQVLCDWATQQEGGYGNTIACDAGNNGGSLTAPSDEAGCVAEYSEGPTALRRSTQTRVT
jgi:hypothetical protein